MEQQENVKPHLKLSKIATNHTTIFEIVLAK
jgi:hypothetical protein